MDYSALALIIGIGVYGLFEYRRREEIHRERMKYLKRGLEPPIVGQKVDFWKLMTTTTSAVILLALTVATFVFGLSRGEYLFVPSLVFGTVFALITVIVVLMVLRDWRLYNVHRDGSREVKS